MVEQPSGRKILGANLKVLMEKHGVTRNKLSADLNVKYTTLTDWIKGRTYPRIDSIEKLTKYFGISKGDLVENQDPREVNKGIVAIPIIGTIAGGSPILTSENIQGNIYEVKFGLPTGPLFYLRVKGKSMEPTIKDGSLVLIHQQPEVENGEVAAVLIDNEATLKRVHRSDGKYILTPDNPGFKPIILTTDTNNQILGKAIRVINELQ
ncbi:LexA family transcriptional regulator [Lentilactobacillus parakefiri]|uniref:Peptidase S24-like protein n=1 Tax=Lentilactobacillus parakefiri TaxID=152332 RepID=A0A224V3B1_9LACO|nr:XRE family transcriptional regulator [Lentilactobacillus parakefiri]PAL00988.1 hypothetical protein B8W96_03540 [Lentilactobacillus parakefiri]TDG94821.1 hypothetical protein C5L28_000860 [Lentilactobacillus parakefiri]GAW71397.1 peptidase S24-like protein [Lentilactobacillus parakefiri]